MKIEIEQFRAVIFKNFLLRTQPAEMEDSDDETPLAVRKKATKRKVESGNDSDDEPLSKKKAKGE